MSKFYRQSLERNDLANDNNLVTVEKALRLIENSEFYDELINLFKVEDIKHEIVPLVGLDKLINSIIFKDEQFQKIDYNVNLVDLSLYDFTSDGKANIKIKCPDSNEIIAETAYNAKSDFFDSAYSLDSFAKFCQKENHIKLLKDNIDHLNEQYQNSNDFQRSVRLLKDHDGKFFLRAITSVSHYNNYDNRFGLFVAALAIKQLSAKNKQFSIVKAEYDESHIKIFFEKNGVKVIPGVGQAKFILEVSNDEIKREALKFSAAFSIVTKEFELLAKPEKLKTQLISIQHNFTPKTVFEYLADLDTFIEKAEEELLNDIADLASITDADQMRHLLMRKVETSKNEDIKAHKVTLNKLLSNRINNISDLLILMNKIDLVITRLEVKEYLRYLFYDILKGKNNKKNS